jgi:hypothetical protein
MKDGVGGSDMVGFRESPERSGVVDSRVGGLAEEVEQKIRLGHRLLQLVDNAAKQHDLALAGIALNP